MGFLQIVNISKLNHMLDFQSNHSTFHVQNFWSVISIQIFSVKNANPSSYAKCVENA
jgi:hypothetical protein